MRRYWPGWILQDQAAFDFLRRDAASTPLFRQLRPGKAVHAKTGPKGELHELRYFLSPEKFLHVERRPDGFGTTEKSYAETTHRAYKSGSIRSSLFAATDGAGIPDAVAMQIARIFSTDIDFHIDLRKGDRFSVVYELVSAQGEPVRAGDVLYAEFVNNGRTYEAFRFTDNEGQSGYYSRDGKNRAKSFLRSPLEFSRVSSGFGSRMHPIFKNWRAHTGVDFAAPNGTRVWSTADGVIEFVGVKGGYGKCIEVRHSGGITTLYAHLSGFAPQTKRGARVRQGELIGFVGRTGYATGPHLHYEFKVSGMHQDPMRVALPKAGTTPSQTEVGIRRRRSRWRGKARRIAHRQRCGIRIAMRDLHIGIMSGTSLDGADAVLMDWSQRTALGFASKDFPAALRSELMALCQTGADEIERAGHAGH